MNWRALLAFAHDVFAAAVACIVAYWLRFNLDIPGFYADIMWARLPWVVGVYAPGKSGASVASVSGK